MNWPQDGNVRSTFPSCSIPGTRIAVLVARAADAVSIAAGLGYASLASDGGGSIRVPSNYCGVVGLKPTHGRVSFHGFLPDAPHVRGQRLPISKTISVAWRYPFGA